MKTYTNEELDDLHNHLHALMSFIGKEAIETMSEGDKVVENHIRALVRKVNDIVFDHGGRQYQPYLTTQTQERSS